MKNGYRWKILKQEIKKGNFLLGAMKLASHSIHRKGGIRTYLKDEVDGEHVDLFFVAWRAGRAGDLTVFEATNGQDSYIDALEDWNSPWYSKRTDQLI